MKKNIVLIISSFFYYCGFAQDSIVSQKPKRWEFGVGASAVLCPVFQDNEYITAGKSQITPAGEIIVKLNFYKHFAISSGLWLVNEHYVYKFKKPFIDYPYLGIGSAYFKANSYILPLKLSMTYTENFIFSAGMAFKNFYSTESNFPDGNNYEPYNTTYIAEMGTKIKIKHRKLYFIIGAIKGGSSIGAPYERKNPFLISKLEFYL